MHFKGETLSRSGKYEEAIECYDRAIEINPNFFSAWNGKGNALDKLGKKKDARRCYKREKELLGYKG